MDKKAVMKQIKQAQSRKDFINLIPVVKAFKETDTAAHWELFIVLHAEYRDKGFRSCKAFPQNAGF